jgi:hypothetical protein
MPVHQFKEHAEFLALRVIVTRLLMVVFRADPDIVEPFTQGVDRNIDTFEFVDGWSDSDVMRGREYMRMAADWIIRPAIRETKRRR